MKFNENVYENVSKFNELNYAADSSEFPANFQRISSEFPANFKTNSNAMMNANWKWIGKFEVQGVMGNNRTARSSGRLAADERFITK